MIRKLFFALLALAIVVLVGLGIVVATHKTRPAPIASAAQDDTAKLIERGAYLSRAGDCVACHSVPGKPDYAGGLAIKSGLGTIYSTNITPDKTHGIGNYTEAQFADALRNGVRADGANLYPAMPYPDFVKISDEDVHALYTYFMQGVAPSDYAPPQTALTFPFGVRPGLKVWNALFTTDAGFTAPAGASEQIARGAYLTESLGHCSSCHTPRGLSMNEQALDSGDAKFLTGGELNGWPVPALRGMAHWSQQDITDYLSGGRNSTAAVGGEMTAVVANSTSHMTDADLQAIAAYLKSLPGAAAPTAKLDPAASQQTIARLTAAKDLSTGERLYLDNCGACHFVSGQGAARVFPHVDGASVVNAKRPDGLLHVILAGAATPSTAKAPSVLPMPGFASRLDDAEVAELATYVRQAWSNQAPAVSAKDAARVRASLHK
ncbi:Cytochrome c, mono-and diheme variants [Pseudoxanthomonas sp. GM95]|uniref:cytochrome c n=1 Tax=Pseudoxanthomonas sp. GM95 TaxID=1881043 RepID=UPI0008B6AE79|nr:cytochrome c [Pseudoxanthomonas sp. GM95]SEL49613.1 Cytochrome c, mono-and diheme variants [Pseudoxanthomonas sp. GM95]